MMKKQLPTLLILLLALTLIISACGSPEQDSLPPARARGTVTAAPPIPTPTDTPELDPCAPENIPSEVEKVHKIMREFDDAYTLASATPKELLKPNISDLQRIRRDAEDQRIPPCMEALKIKQLEYMNAAIDTTLYLMSYQGTEEERNALSQAIVLAHQLHNQYTLELATLLGLTVVVPSTPDPVQGTPQPETPQADVTPAPALLVITNPGPTAVNLRSFPDLNAETLGILAIDARAVVLGRTADALWYQIEFPDQPGQTAWVYASLVQLSDLAAELPVITP